MAKQLTNTAEFGDASPENTGSSAAPSTTASSSGGKSLPNSGTANGSTRADQSMSRSRKEPRWKESPQDSVAILLGLAGQISAEYPDLLSIRQNADFVVIGFSAELLPIATSGNDDEGPSDDTCQ